MNAIQTLQDNIVTSISTCSFDGKDDVQNMMDQLRAFSLEGAFPLAAFEGLFANPNLKTMPKDKAGEIIKAFCSWYLMRTDLDVQINVLITMFGLYRGLSLEETKDMRRNGIVYQHDMCCEAGNGESVWFEIKEFNTPEHAYSRKRLEDHLEEIEAVSDFQASNELERCLSYNNLVHLYKFLLTIRGNIEEEDAYPYRDGPYYASGCVFIAAVCYGVADPFIDFLVEHTDINYVYNYISNVLGNVKIRVPEGVGEY